MNNLQLLMVGLALLGVVACAQQPTEGEIRAIVRSEVEAVIAEVKQGPQGEQGPLPSNELLAGLISETILELKEELRGPQGIPGKQGPAGIRGPQGIPGTAQLSQSDRATLSRVNTLERDLSNLRSEIECEVKVTSSLFRGLPCSSSLQGASPFSMRNGSTIGSRVSSLESDISSLETDILNLQSIVRQLQNNAHRHTTRLPAPRH